MTRHPRADELVLRRSPREGLPPSSWRPAGAERAVNLSFLCRTSRVLGVRHRSGLAHLDRPGSARPCPSPRAGLGEEARARSGEQRRAYGCLRSSARRAGPGRAAAGLARSGRRWEALKSARQQRYRRRESHLKHHFIFRLMLCHYAKGPEAPTSLCRWFSVFSRELEGKPQTACLTSARVHARLRSPRGPAADVL